jgi:hypothetical protein
MEFKVNNCQECPFVNNDNECGFNFCSIKNIKLDKQWDELPDNDVHKDCPLKENSVTVKLN